MARKPFSKFSKRWLDRPAAGRKRSCHNLTGWHDYVRGFGLKQARQGLLINPITDGNPEN